MANPKGKPSSTQTDRDDGPMTMDRARDLDAFMKEIDGLLESKRPMYGDRTSFAENNRGVDYIHALTEAKYKLDQFRVTRGKRDLIKAAAWIYLIFEGEILRRAW